MNLASLWNKVSGFAAALGLVGVSIQQALRMKKMSEAVVTAGADPTAAATVMLHPAVAPVVTAIQSKMAPTSNWAQVAASALNAFIQVTPTALSVASASTKTTAEVELGEEALALLIGALFPHPQAQAG